MKIFDYLVSAIVLSLILSMSTTFINCGLALAGVLPWHIALTSLGVFLTVLGIAIPIGLIQHLTEE